jgi:hypothetical protein
MAPLCCCIRLPLSIPQENADFKAVSRDALAQERIPEIDVAVSVKAHAPTKKPAPASLPMSLDPSKRIPAKRSCKANLAAVQGVVSS